MAQKIHHKYLVLQRSLRITEKGLCNFSSSNIDALLGFYPCGKAPELPVETTACSLRNIYGCLLHKQKHIRYNTKEDQKL